LNGDGSIDEGEYLQAMELQMRSKFFFSQAVASQRADLVLEWASLVAGCNMPTQIRLDLRLQLKYL
jgi:hypothetical protein